MTIWQYAILRYVQSNRNNRNTAEWAVEGNVQTYRDTSVLYLLDEAGAQGWELVGIFVRGDRPGGGAIIEYTFKQPQYGS
jgi:hypothetical protein